MYIALDRALRAPPQSKIGSGSSSSTPRRDSLVCAALSNTLLRVALSVKPSR